MEYLSVFLTSLGLNLLLIFVSKRFGFFLDRPSEERKVHRGAVPRTGGLAVYPSVFLFSAVKKLLVGVKLSAVALPLIFIAVVEDFKSLSPYIRFVFIFASAVLAVFYLNAVVWNLGLFTLPALIAYPFTVFAIVGAVNAFNIVDGLNGLVSGISLAILLTYAYLFALSGREELSHFSLLVAAALLGFFVLNFPKGLVFLGDTGSYFLGFTVGVLSVLLAGGKQTPISPWVPMVEMFYPIWETVYSIRRRLKEGKSPFEPDKGHFHFLLFRFFGNSHLKATGAILTFQVVLSLVVVLLYKSTYALILLFLGLVFVYSKLYGFLRERVNL